MKKIFFGGFFVLMCSIPFSVQAASLYFGPERTEVRTGEEIRVAVVLDTENVTVNALSVGVLIPDGMTVQGVETGNSVINLWIRQPLFDREKKEVRLIGGIPGGFNGRAVVATILLKINDGENKNLVFADGVEVLANDGEGTAVETILIGTNFKITTATRGPVVNSRTNPDEDKWYTERTVEISWTQQESTEYSLVFDDNPESIPDTIAEERETPLKIEGVPDGVHYFHIREGQDGQWGETTHFRVQADGTPPEVFSLTRADNQIIWQTDDKASGIDHYDLTFVPQPFIRWPSRRVNSPYKVSFMAKNLGGRYVVNAVDKAGNAREAILIMQAGKVLPTVATIIIIVVGIFGATRVWQWRQKLIKK